MELAAVITLVALVIVCVVAGVAAWETVCDWEVVDAVLHGGEPRRVRILYGKHGWRPFSWGRDRMMRIVTRVDAVDVDPSPEKCVEAGIRLQHSLGYDGSEYATPRARWHEWRLTR